ncbi:olfactory receptor 5AR1-like [Gastrophryne carolinensis]
MEDTNWTSSDVFILLGLSQIWYLQIIYFLIFLLMYISTISGNVLLVTVVRINPTLQTPMYFFLTNLSVIDICFTTSITPKILINTLSKDRSISFWACGAQMYFSLALGATECIILAVMAYDRFAAICKPLHYNTIMNRKLCAAFAAGSWSFCFLVSAIHVSLTFQLNYCRSHHVNHFFCEMPPFLQLSCSDTKINEIAMYVGAGLIVSCSFLLILVSYVQIISTILKISSSQGRKRTFSTCASHLTVVALYYGTIMFMYLRPHSTYSPEKDKTVSILYTTVTPMLNPIIYSMRNKDVKGTITKKFLKWTKTHGDQPGNL